MGASREYGKLYPVAKAIVKPLVFACWRINVTGLHHVPEHGPAILCPNHISFFDSIVVPAVLPRRVSYVGKAEYLDDWKTRHLFPNLGMIPIDRTGGKEAMAALDTAAAILDRGELFGIYPEGTRSRDGKLHRGRTGAARLAVRTGAPIIPVGLRGTDHIQPTGASAPRPFLSCQVDIGAPIDVSRYQDEAGNRLLYRQLTDEIMFEIRKLSGQEYVDVYAGSRAQGEGETEPSGTNGAPVATPSEPSGATPDGAPDSPPDAGSESGPERIAVPVPAREPVLAGRVAGRDVADVDVRPSSADVLAKWWS